MEKNQKIIKIKVTVGDPSGKLIRRGSKEKLTIEIADGAAVYYFTNRKTTENFARIEIEGDQAKGLKQTTFFQERIGKTLKTYEGTKKEVIRDLVLEQLKKLNLNARELKSG